MGKKRIDSVSADCASFENLLGAWGEMRKNGGRGSLEIAEYGRMIETNLVKVVGQLEDGSWRPGPYRSFPISDPKPRIIDAPDVGSRLVQKAMLRPLKARLFAKMCPCSYAGIPGKGPLRACWKVRDHINSYPAGVPLFYLHFDFRHCYQTVDHDVFLNHLNTFVRDRWWMDILRTITENYVNKDTGKGVPLGAETSKDGVNCLFSELDRELFDKRRLKVVRYTDDGIVISDDRAELEEARAFIDQYARKRLRMELHPGKTAIGDARKGIDCFGYVVFAEGLRPRKRNVAHALNRIKKLRRDADAGLASEERIRRSLCSFLGYMKPARWSRWAQQVLDASGLWDREILKAKIIKPKHVRDQIAWQMRERRRQQKALALSKSEPFNNV